MGEERKRCGVASNQNRGNSNAGSLWDGRPQGQRREDYSGRAQVAEGTWKDRGGGGGRRRPQGCGVGFWPTKKQIHNQETTGRT